MGKYLGVIVGAVVSIVGFLGLLRWFKWFIVIAKGCLPIMLVLGGIIAIIAGLSELKDEAAAKKEETK